MSRRIGPAWTCGSAAVVTRLSRAVPMKRPVDHGCCNLRLDGSGSAITPHAGPICLLFVFPENGAITIFPIECADIIGCTMYIGTSKER